MKLDLIMLTEAARQSDYTLPGLTRRIVTDPNGPAIHTIGDGSWRCMVRSEWERWRTANEKDGVLQKLPRGGARKRAA